MPNIPSASDMLESGKAAALAEAIRLISLNASHGSVELALMPRVIALHVEDALVLAHYKIKRHERRDGDDLILTVRWA